MFQIRGCVLLKAGLLQGLGCIRGVASKERIYKGSVVSEAELFLRL